MLMYYIKLKCSFEIKLDSFDNQVQKKEHSILFFVQILLILTLLFQLVGWLLLIPLIPRIFSCSVESIDSLLQDFIFTSIINTRDSVFSLKNVSNEKPKSVWSGAGTALNCHTAPYTGMR